MTLRETILHVLNRGTYVLGEAALYTAVREQVKPEPLGTEITRVLGCLKATGCVVPGTCGAEKTWKLTQAGKNEADAIRQAPVCAPPYTARNSEKWNR